MIINGKWMNEPEILALISQLIADKKRLEKHIKELDRCGHWIDSTSKTYSPTRQCSECGKIYPIAAKATGEIYTPKFCEECGADMRGDKSNA